MPDSSDESRPGADPPAGEPERSRRLVARLHEVIARAGGAIDFSEFMQRALFEPGLGYYVAGRPKLGPAGDFITAPESGGLFGRCLARQCREVLNRLGGGDILEFGAGSGQLCARLLSSLAQADELPGRYYILELSPALRQRQQETVAAQCPDLAGRCRWLDSLPEAFTGVAIANEVLDAMPVERFRVTENGLDIVQVAREGPGFRDTTRPAGVGELGEIADLGLAPGYESEAGVLAGHWMAAAADWLDRGVVLVIDYGFPRHEFYHPHRSSGTLMCHHRHRAHTDPYIHVGGQDITAHLDFTALARRADEAGLDVLGFTHQAAFLISLGLVDIVQAAMNEGGEDRRWPLSQEVQRLTQTYEMGELFKVLAVGRGVREPLAGFADLDHRARL